MNKLDLEAAAIYFTASELMSIISYYINRANELRRNAAEENYKFNETLLEEARTLNNFLNKITKT